MTRCHWITTCSAHRCACSRVGTQPHGQTCDQGARSKALDAQARRAQSKTCHFGPQNGDLFPRAPPFAMKSAILLSSRSVIFERFVALDGRFLDQMLTHHLILNTSSLVAAPQRTAHRPAAPHSTHQTAESRCTAQLPCRCVPSSPAPADSAICRHPQRLASTGTQKLMADQASACMYDHQLLWRYSSRSTRPSYLRRMSSQRADR